MLSGFALAAFDGRPCVLSSCRAPGDEEAQVENLITANGTCHGLLPRGRGGNGSPCVAQLPGAVAFLEPARHASIVPGEGSPGPLPVLSFHLHQTGCYS